MAVLEEGKRRGLLGPGPVERQIEHALAFGSAVASIDGAVSAPLLDLGTGGGLPGLVLAFTWPESRWTLLDSRRRSVEFVTEAADALGLAERVRVLHGRAEEIGRDPAHRGRHGVVAARGFGPPAVTAEAAAPLLRVPGWLVVSEPPEPEGERWPEGPLARLGLRFVRLAFQQATFAVLEQVKPCPPGFPRRVGVALKRPLFTSTLDPDVSRETHPGT